MADAGVHPARWRKYGGGGAVTKSAVQGGAIGVRQSRVCVGPGGVSGPGSRSTGHPLYILRYIYIYNGLREPVTAATV